MGHHFHRANPHDCAARILLLLGPSPRIPQHRAYSLPVHNRARACQLWLVAWLVARRRAQSPRGCQAPAIVQELGANMRIVPGYKRGNTRGVKSLLTNDAVTTLVLLPTISAPLSLYSSKGPTCLYVTIGRSFDSVSVDLGNFYSMGGGAALPKATPHSSTTRTEPHVRM